MPPSVTEKIVFLTHLFAYFISVHNGDIKHARAIEFNYMNLLAMLTDYMVQTGEKPYLIIIQQKNV